MSQRLLLAHSSEVTSEDDCYDLILTEKDQAVRVRMSVEFFHETGDFFLGPWKIRVRNLDVYRQHEKGIKEAFESVGKDLDDVSGFFVGDKRMTYSEFRALLDE